MSWESFYLICFLVGLVLTLLSLLAGIGKIHFLSRWHFPRTLGHHAGAVATRGIGHSSGVGAGRAAIANASGQHASYFNFSSIMAFLAWFGGTGFLLTRYSNVWAVLAFGIAMASGLVAATIVSLFLIKVLLAHDSTLDPADFELVGVLGNVNVGIRPGGTGEIIFSQAGARRVVGARSDDGRAIPKNSEVVVMRYNRGIAYVRCWADVAEQCMTQEQAAETKQ